MERTDVVVVGGGPAGAAVAAATASRGLATVLVDPSPGRAWPATYGAWADELLPGLPGTVVAGRMDDARAVGRTGTVHRLGREYVVLSTSALQAALAHPGVRTAAGSAVRVAGGVAGAVELSDGEVVAGRAVIDASGPRRVLTGGPPPAPRASQTAAGVILPAAVAAATGGAPPELAFMDWRDDHGEEGWPTFLYAVPVGGGAVLLEETSLARRPGLGIPVLRRRLAARLAHRGVVVPEDAASEVVSFPVDLPVARGTGAVVPYGAAAPLVHPATGYSLATALALAGPVAEALEASIDDGPDAAGAAVRAVVWPPGARLVHQLRRRGLEVLLSLPAEGVGDFFDVFFSLPSHHQRAYLSERARPLPVLAAMASVYARSDGPLRRHLRRWGHPLAGDVAPAEG